jgi:trans-2,3-dihydro-3-hydroxyanthranilate isomerase
MRVDIAWWELDGSSAQTIQSLQEHLDHDTVSEWARVPGLRMKLWIADRHTNRWGAVMLWESDRPTDEALPENRAAKLIGRPPDQRLRFETEIGVEGLEGLGLDCGLGLAGT